mgnify:CR=1 FL=1|tara:strand:- start:297 stop:521 length:225 start_codon:yes stop_codon:yes gene_type:complete
MKINDIDFPKPPRYATHARLEALGGGIAHVTIKAMDTLLGTSGQIYYGRFRSKSPAASFEVLDGPYEWDGEKIT